MGNEQHTWEQAFETLSKCKWVLITCHANPDTDALNSVIAMCLFLKGLNVLYNVSYQGRSMSEVDLPRAVFQLHRVHHREVSISKYGALIVLDTAVTSQLGIAGRFLTDARRLSIPIINIDHHEVNPGFGDYNIIDPNAAASCEILYDLFRSVNCKISREMAHVLLRGIYGDTDVLRTYNVTPKTVRTTADLIELGANRLEIIEQSSYLDFRRAKIWVRVLDRMEVVDGTENIVYSIVDESVVGERAENEGPLDGVTNFMRDLKGIDLAILFIQRPHEVKLSFRSKATVSALSIAQRFGGGGHYAAAGCEFPGRTIDDVKSQVLSIARKMVSEQLAKHVEE